VRKLPYRARTATGDHFDFEFPLHAETQSAVRVGQLVSAVLDALDKDIALAGATSNGDVLQAFAMAMAIRTRMIHAHYDTLDSLSTQLLRTALDAVSEAPRHSPKFGRA